MSRSFLLFLAAAATAWPLVRGVGAGQAPAVIELDPSSTFQRISGWEVPILPEVREDYMPVLPGFKSVFEQASTDLGLTRVHLVVASGYEHPPGYGAKYLEGVMPLRIMRRDHYLTIVNDNSSPNGANLKRFEFAILDWQMEHMVVPYRQALQAAGHDLYLYLNYAAWGPSSYQHLERPDEYAEFMLVIFDHLKAKFGFAPDGINVINEPDRFGWTGTMIGKLVAKTGARLSSAGYRVDFQVPGVMNGALAVKYFNDAIAVSGARQYITDLSYHCYRDVGANHLADIARRAAEAKVNVAMNECWGNGSTYELMHRGLKEANSSTWQQGTLNGSRSGYYAIDPVTFNATLTTRTKLMRQYYKYVRPGARRIAATTSAPAFDPLAFINADGKYVTVIKVDGNGTFSIANLPAGSYGISYTTRNGVQGTAPDVTITEGQIVPGPKSQTGVVTVYGK